MRRAATVLLALAAACSPEEPARVAVRTPARPPEEPARTLRVTYDHILIAFEGVHEEVRSSLTKEEAGALARSLHQRVKDGIVAWDRAKAEFSDDRMETGQPRGPYTMVNVGVPHAAGEIARLSAARAVGDMVFFLKVGEIGLVEYDPRSSPWGWHIIKRLR